MSMDKPDPASAAVRVMNNFGLAPDPWQLDVLTGSHRRLLLNCCRQAGKSTVVAVHALLQAVYTPDLLVLLLSRSHRQSAELFHSLTGFYGHIKAPIRLRQTVEELALTNGSRIVSLPCREETIRGYANVGLLIIDEAARVPDDLYRAVRPMLAVSGGSLICMSTPFGKRGFFYEAWANGGDDWQRIEVHAEQIPRIEPTFLAQERRCLGESFFRQEYECSFEALEGLVYPDLATCVVPARTGDTRKEGKQVGGIDFGFRNPFAAVWGVLDGDNVLWLEGEHYCRERPLSYNAARLPREVQWYADPAGANERAELLCAGFTVRKGDNALRTGIAAVTARIQSARLKIVAGACPNLLAEASLYRYSDDPREKNRETPVDDHNHALGALRYLITRIDARKLARTDAGPLPTNNADADPEQPPPPKPWLRFDNEDLWTAVS